MFGLKKGAMFGLDARIALAIFGALSVISGAALYSAIQESKVTSIITEMTELGKSWEQMYLDTSQMPAYIDNATPTSWDYHVVDSQYLVNDPNINGWKGPYVDYKVESGKLRHNKYYNLFLMNLKEDDGWDFWPDGICTTGKTCSLWSVISGFKDLSVILSVDKKIDKSDGGDSGNFRWYGDSTTSPHYYRIIYKVSAVDNRHD